MNMKLLKFKLNKNVFLKVLLNSTLKNVFKSIFLILFQLHFHKDRNY